MENFFDEDTMVNDMNRKEKKSRMRICSSFVCEDEKLPQSSFNSGDDFSFCV